MKLGLRRRSLRRRYGRTARKYGKYMDAHGRQRMLGRWAVYRGFTLDPWKGPVVEHSKATYEVKIYKGSSKNMEGNTYGETLDDAMAKARRLVNAMLGD